RNPPRGAVTRVRVQRGALDTLGTIARATGPHRAAVIADAPVAALYGQPALASLARAGIAAQLVTIPPRERPKRPPQLPRLSQALDELEIGRRDVLVALGGGVGGDLAGLAAAPWL